MINNGQGNEAIDYMSPEDMGKFAALSHYTLRCRTIFQLRCEDAQQAKIQSGKGNFAES